MIDEEISVSSYGEEDPNNKSSFKQLKLNKKQESLMKKKEKTNGMMKVNVHDESMNSEETDIKNPESNQNHLGHFDDDGQFIYNTQTNFIDEDYFNAHSNSNRKMHLNLKDLSEQNFVDLIAAKN